jgi:hypothetical protein
MSADTPPAGIDVSPETLGTRLAEAVAQGAPVAIFRGTVSIYATPDGGMHIAYRSRDADEATPDGHMPLPPALIRMIMAQASGANPLAMVKAMMG